MSLAFRIGHAERNFGAAFRQHHGNSPASEDEAKKFKSIFADLTRECSPDNIQTCTDWLVPNTLTSPDLVDAFGSFISSVSSAYAAEKQKQDGMSKADVRRKLWPLIFLINEVLHATKFKWEGGKEYTLCAKHLRIAVINVFKDLSQFSSSTSQKHFKRLRGLLAYWHQVSYFDNTYIRSLKTVVDSEGLELPAESKEFALQKQKRSKSGSNRPQKKPKLDPTKGIQILGGIDEAQENGEWKLPEWHGVENAPWHLVPAASWLAPLRQSDHESGNGMRKAKFASINFEGKDVSRQLRKEVQKLLDEADRIYNPAPISGKRIEYDAMGRKLEVVKVKRGLSGKVKKYVKCDTYYGWSAEFLEEMYHWPERGFLSKNVKQGVDSGSVSSNDERGSPERPLQREPYAVLQTPSHHVKQQPKPTTYAPQQQQYAPPPPPHQQQYPLPPPPQQYPPQQQQQYLPPPPPQQQYPPPPPHAQGTALPPPPPPPWAPGQGQNYSALPPNWTAPWPPPPPPAPLMPGQQGWPAPPPPPPMQQQQGFNGNWNNQSPPNPGLNGNFQNGQNQPPVFNGSPSNGPTPGYPGNFGGNNGAQNAFRGGFRGGYSNNRGGRGYGRGY